MYLLFCPALKICAFAPPRPVGKRSLKIVHVSMFMTYILKTCNTSNHDNHRQQKHKWLTLQTPKLQMSPLRWRTSRGQALSRSSRLPDYPFVQRHAGDWSNSWAHPFFKTWNFVDLMFAFFTAWLTLRPPWPSTPSTSVLAVIATLTGFLYMSQWLWWCSLVGLDENYGHGRPRKSWS